MPNFREAGPDDLATILALLRDDILGRTREGTLTKAYAAAFDAICANPIHHLIVADTGSEIVGCYQLTIIDGLSLRASRRALIEGVRIAESHRGGGFGTQLMADAERRAAGAGCSLIQLTTHRDRLDAHRFYDRLGFTPSHIGYKKAL